MSRLLPLALLVTAAPIAAQVVQIPSMTIASTRFDADSLAVGATTVNAIRTSATPYLAQIASLTLTPNTAVQGYYNFNVDGGRGLARDSVTNVLSVVPPGSFFNPFDATIDLEVEGTEFGFSVGDWSGGMIVDLRRRSDDSLVARFTTPQFQTTAVQFFQSSTAFDRVVLRADSTDGNWVLTEFHVAANLPWEPFGSGCPGSNGTPTLSSTDVPQIGTNFDLSITDMPTAGGFYLLTLGLSTTVDPGLGALPFDLGGIGASGCLVLASVEQSFFSLQTGGVSSFAIPIPNDQVFLGVRFANQAFATDAVNALGFIASNGGIATIQP